MKCPVCDNEMQPGGLITGLRGGAVSWLPVDKYEKSRGPLRAQMNGKILMAENKFFSGQRKIPNAFFCEKCNKIVGIFELDE